MSEPVCSGLKLTCLSGDSAPLPLKEDERMFERSVFTSGGSLADCIRPS